MHDLFSSLSTILAHLQIYKGTCTNLFCQLFRHCDCGHPPVINPGNVHVALRAQDVQPATGMQVLSLAQRHELRDDVSVAWVPHVLPRHTGHPGVGQNVGVPQPYVTVWKRPMLLGAACMNAFQMYTALMQNPESTASLHAFELACVVLLLMTQGTPAARDVGTPQPWSRNQSCRTSLQNESQYQHEALH